MDNLQEYEVNDILENLPYLDRNSWEQCRSISYITAQVNSKKKLNPSDILSLPFDNDSNDEVKITEISNEDIKRLEEKAKSIRNGNKQN